MSSTLLIFFVALVVVGLALAFLGRRGFKRNNHPQCRWCGFDLHAAYPGALICPECGAGLNREKAVRNGVYTRSPLLIVLGLLISLLAAVPLVLVVYAGATGTNLNRYKPLPLLLFESRRAGPDACSQIAGELLQRVKESRLDKPQQARVVSATLDLQADSAGPWHEKWGELFRALEKAGSATPEQVERFAKQAPVLTASHRRAVRAGQPLPIRITSPALRCGPDDQFNVMMSCVSVTLNPGGVTLKPPASVSIDRYLRPSAALWGSEYPQVWVQALGSTTSARWGGGAMSQAMVLHRSVPGTLSPGEYTATVEVSLRLHETDTRVTRSQREANARRVKVTLPVTVLASDGPDSVQLVAPTPEMTEKLTASFRATAPTLRGTLYDSFRSRATTQGARERSTTSADEEAVYQVSYQPGDPATFPVEVCFDVIARIEGVEHVLGIFASGEGIVPYVRGKMPITLLSAQPPSVPTAKTADLIFRPRPDLARRTPDLTRIYNGEIVLKDVPITLEDSRQKKTVPPQRVKIVRP